MVSPTNKRELAWTLAVVVLLAGIAVWSTFVLFNISGSPPPGNPSEFVEVIGEQWSWEFHYYANNTTYTSSYDAATNTVSGGALWALPGAVVQLNVTSADVAHSLYMPQLGVQINAIPGRMNTINFQVPNVAAGSQYIIECTEFCGTGHGTMRSFLVVT